MICQCDIYLQKADNSLLGTELSAKIHGFLLTNINTEISAKLHSFGEVRPYSLFTMSGKTQDLLRINILNEYAYEFINYIKSINSFFIKGLKEPLKILDIFETKVNFNELETELKTDFKIVFCSTTTYKKDNVYSNWFDLSRLSNSIIKKLELFENIVVDKSILYGDSSYYRVLGYELSSSYFKLANVNVAGMIGGIKIRLNCDNENLKLLNLILNYSQYSGMGAKTAMGMGGVIIE